MVLPRFHLLLSISICAATVFVGSCGGGVKTYGHRDEKRNFAVLPKATTKHDLPFLVRADRKEKILCFKKLEGQDPVGVTEDIIEVFEHNEAEINLAIQSWFLEDLAFKGLTKGMVKKWEVEVDSPSVIKLRLDQLRFENKQECIQDKTMWLPWNMRAVTTLFGASVFHFTTSDPIKDDVRDRMKRVLKKKAGMTMEFEKPVVYKPLHNRRGKPKRDKEGEKLFKSSKGEIVPENELPDPEDLMLKSWTVKSDKPLYFGYRGLSDIAWQIESRVSNCDLFLIWNDSTPRYPECQEFKEAGFMIVNNDLRRRGKRRKARTKEGEVVVIINVDDAKVDRTLTYNKKTMVQVNDRIVLWIEPGEIEEGAILQIDSLVLDPVQPGGAEAPLLAADGSKVEDRPITPLKTRRAKAKKAKSKDKKSKEEKADKKKQAKKPVPSKEKADKKKQAKKPVPSKEKADKKKTSPEKPADPPKEEPPPFAY